MVASKERAGYRPEVPPPDGGWGWMVVMAAFIAHAIVHGVVYSFGILFIALEERFSDATKSEIAWIPSITSGTLYLIGPLGSILITRYGCRTVTVFGSLLSAVGILLSMFVQNLYLMYVTLGFLTGCGFGLVFLPAIVVVTKYFSKYRSLACGVALSGAGSGAFIFSPLMERLLDEYRLHGTFLIMSAILLNCVPCGLLFRSLHKLHTRTESDIYDSQNPTNTSLLYGETVLETHKVKETLTEGNINMDGNAIILYNNDTGEYVDIKLKNALKGNTLQTNGNNILIEVETTDLLHGNTKETYTANMDDDSQVETAPATPGLLQRYLNLFHHGITVVFFLSQFLFFFGFYLPFIYIPDKATSLGIEESDAAWVASTIGLSSIVGRIILGYIADRPSVNRILLFKIAMATAGISTAFGPVLNTLWLMVIYAVIYGVSTGITLSLTSVVLVDFVGIHLLPDVMGMNNLFSGFGSLLGPPFAGFLYDWTGSYTSLFMVPGCALTVSAILLFMTPLCTTHSLRK